MAEGMTAGVFGDAGGADGGFDRALQDAFVGVGAADEIRARVDGRALGGEDPKPGE